MYKFCLFFFSFVASAAMAQYKGMHVVYLHPKTGNPALIRFASDAPSLPNAENLGPWMQQNLNTDGHFRLRYSRTENGLNGYTHLRYQQYYGRFPVESGQVILHLKNQRAVSLSGKYFPEIAPDTNALLSAADAVGKALSLYPSAIFMWEIPAEEALLRRIRKNPAATYKPQPELMLISVGDSCRSSDFRLVYKLDVHVYEPMAREWMYIDARTGEVLRREDQICTVNRTGTAYTKYAGIRSIECDSIAADTFILMDHTRGGGISTVDARPGGTDSTVEFIDHDNIWNNVNAFKDEVATDVHWGSAATYDYFSRVHGRNSYDNQGGLILSKVHVGNKYNNAYWNGIAAHYGDGDGINLKPLTSIDVCAHELTHGVTGNSAGLRYRYESGALNESFSDIFGKTIEFEVDSAGFSWVIAEKIALRNPFRDMSFPPNYGHPKYYMGNLYRTGSADNGGVHSNSGVQNYWYYLLCEGGKGIREKDSLPFAVEPIGMQKAAQIAYQTLTGALISESEYADACYMSSEVARNLYGENSFEHRMVQRAWYAVGLLSPSEMTGIQNPAHASLWKIFPNPGQHKIRVQNPAVFEAAEIEITDISGKVLMQTSLDPLSELDLSMLENGIYLIRINRSEVHKWIKN